MNDQRRAESQHLSPALCLVKCLSVMTCRQQLRGLVCVVQQNISYQLLFNHDPHQELAQTGRASLFKIPTKTREIKSLKKAFSQETGSSHGSDDGPISPGLRCPGVRRAVMALIHVNIDNCLRRGGVNLSFKC